MTPNPEASTGSIAAEKRKRVQVVRADKRMQQFRHHVQRAG
jgi:hypothetical protein